METSVRYRREHWTAISLMMFIASVVAQALPQSDRRDVAISLEQQGKTAEAEAAWGALAKTYPANPEPFAHLGLLEARQEHYAEAIRFYRKALALNPAMPGLRLNLGLALFKDGDYKDAILMFSPLLKAQPDDQRLIVLMGMSHYGLREYATATPYLKQAADRDAQNLTLLLTLAHSCLLSKQFPCVLDAFHRIESLNAESAEADILVGEALSEMKDTYGAIREFRAAVAANPKEPNVHFGLGYLLWTERQYPEAASEFQAEVDNDPHHMQAMLYLANSEIEMNRMDDAKPLLEKVVKNIPENSMGHLDLGIVYTDEDRKQDALAQFQVAARLAPSDVNAHWRMGRLYRAMGKKAEAKVELDKASNLNKATNDGILKMMSGLPDKGHEQDSQAGSPEHK
jgi:tetratricopeptide (TPR) repeat protein